MSYNVCQAIHRNILEGMGSPIRAWEIAKNVGYNDHNVFACSVSDKNETIKKEGVTIYKKRIKELSPFELSYFYNSVIFSRFIKKCCKRNSADIIHAHMFRAAFSSSMVGKPVIYDMHGFFPNENFYRKNTLQRLRWSSSFLAENIIRKKSDFIVATSDTLREVLIKFGVPEERVESIPVGVNTDLFKPGKKENAIRKRYGLEGHDVVLYAGGIEPYQGIDTLFKSIPLVLKERKVKFLVVGGGLDFEKYRKMVNKAKFNDDVIMTGGIDYNHMPDFIRSADVGLSLRRLSLMGHVSFPTKLTTYMAGGIPCIATNNGDQMRIIKRNKTGFLFPSDDEKGLAESILYALSDKASLKRMGKKAREIAEKEFSWSVLAKKYIKIYEKVLN